MPDFFGEETDPFANPATAGAVTKPAGAKASTASDQAAYAAKQGPGPGYVGAPSERYAGSGIATGGTGGATAGYSAGSDASRAEYDYMHDLGSADPFKAPGQVLNSIGEQVGVSHAGDAAGGDWLGMDQWSANSITNLNPTAGILDTQTGLGVAGKPPVAAMAPGAAALAGSPMASTVGAGVAQALGAGAGGTSFNTSGADRGGMRTDTAAAAGRAGGQADAARQLGAGVLSGQVAPGGAGAQGQQDVLDQVMAYARAPQQGPSKAELLLQQASQGNMADVLSAARSGRARDAGSQARAMNVAQGEIAGLGVDAARNAALLRAQEEQDFRNQQLSALGLGGDVSGAIRGAGIQERGQNLDFAQGQQQIGAGLEGDILKLIPQMEQVRHEDEFDLTPQQKLAAAQMGGPRDPTTTDYIMGILGDVLPMVGSL